MNTTNILLGTTSLLLVVGFALSFGGFTKNRENSNSKEELAALKEEIEKIKAEEKVIELSQLRTTTPAPVIPTAPVSTEVGPVSEDMKRVIEAQKDKIASLESEKEVLAIEKEAVEKENNKIFVEKSEAKKEQSMAAFRIKNALAMGTVTTANKENALVIFTPSPSATNFQPGKILAVRRNTGIIGTIQIDRLAETGEYVATMRPHGYSPDGYPDIQPGDIIIINHKG
jgi:hypothetical protein